jgi:DNA polymerase-3 subunit beta
MKLTIPRSEIKEAVAGLSRIVSNKTTLPILGCVRFDVNGDVTAQATDLEQTARFTFVGSTATGTGSMIIPFQTMKELGKGNDKESVEFETSDDLTVTVTNHVGANAVKHPIAGTPADEWPVCPDNIETKPASGFLETYKRLIPFASTDATRCFLNGVFIEVAEKGEHPITMVATDGRRLSLWNTMNLPISMSVIVPATKFLAWTGLQVAEQRIGIKTAEVKEGKNAKQIRVVVKGFGLNVGPWSYDVRTLDGSYPNFRQVIPGDMPGDINRITLTDEDVAALQKILPTFPGANTNSEGIDLLAGTDGKLVISGRAPDDKKATTLELTGGSRFEGKMPGICVNRNFLLDALGAGFRVFTTMDEMSPLKSADGRGGIHVLMPLRLGTEPITKVEPQPEPAVGETPPPATEPPAPAPGAEAGTTEPMTETEPKTRRRTMPEKQTEPTEPTTLDKALVAVDAARAKLREAGSALTDLTDTLKAAVKEGKAQAAEVEKARATLVKLQAISL